MQRKWLILFWLFTLFLSLLLHWRVFSLDLMGPHVWRQTQTQTYTKNMVRGEGSLFAPRVNNLAFGDNGLMPMEFPLLQWGTARVIKITGWDDVVVARWMSFLIGLISMLGMFYLLKWITRSTKAGILGAWAFCWSPLFYYYTVNPLPDVLALGFGIWGLAFSIRWLRTNHLAFGFLASLLICLAALSKLPFIVFGAGLLVIWIQHWHQFNWSPVQGIGKGLVLALPLLAPAAWYISVIPQWGSNGVLAGIAENQRSIGDLLYILQGHLFSTLPELLLNYGTVLFFIIGLICFVRNKFWRERRGAVLGVIGLTVLAYFFFELNMIGLEHDYYLFPFLPLLVVLVVTGARWMLRQEKSWIRTLALICLISLPLLAFLRIDSRWNPEKPGFNRTLLEKQPELQQTIPPTAKVIAGSDESGHIWLYYLDRDGYTFTDENFSEKLIRRFIEKGAAYLVTDLNLAVELAETNNYSLVSQIKDISIYEIK